ncbi:MAG: putative tellurite resistance protein B-like protein, partial [Chitinophagales bacterium]
MKSALKRFLENLLPPEETVETDEEALNFAAALLLFEVANADYNLDDIEWQSMKKALNEVLGINTDNADKLLKIAESHSQSNTSLQPFTRLINDEFGIEQK